MTRQLGIIIFVYFGAIAALASRGAAVEPDMPPTVAAGAELVEVFGDDRFFEGPTWDAPTGRLFFTAFRGRDTQILVLNPSGDVAVWLDKTEGVNGTFRSKEGRLLGAQAYGHRLMSYDFGTDGPTNPRVLYASDQINQPNDVCQTPRGDIYFTDPDFGKRKTSAVYRRDTEGAVTKVLSDMRIPNGLIASNDGRTLYVGDSHLKHWRAYPIGEDGTVGKGRLFFDPATDDRRDPDGMTIDEHGNLYLAGRGGVWAVDPAGKPLGLIRTKPFCSNVTFGGVDGKTLWLTCKGKVYRLAMTVRGGQTTRN